MGAQRLVLRLWHRAVPAPEDPVRALPAALAVAGRRRPAVLSGGWGAASQAGTNHAAADSTPGVLDCPGLQHLFVALELCAHRAVPPAPAAPAHLDDLPGRQFVLGLSGAHATDH